jgi:hypothetical protein
VSQFAKHYVKFPHEGQPDAAREFCAAAAAAYEPKRKFRKQADSDFTTPDAHVEATLLEYGQRIFSSAVVSTDATSGAGDASDAKDGGAKTKSAASALAAKLGMAGGAAGGGKKTAEEEAAAAAAAELEEKSRMERVAGALAAVEGDARLSGAQIGKIVSLQADAIREASDAYADELAALGSGGGAGGAGVGGPMGAARTAEQQHARQVEALKRQETVAHEKHAEIAAAHESEYARVSGKRTAIEVCDARVTWPHRISFACFCAIMSMRALYLPDARALFISYAPIHSADTISIRTHVLVFRHTFLFAHSYTHDAVADLYTFALFWRALPHLLERAGARSIRRASGQRDGQIGRDRGRLQQRAVQAPGEEVQGGVQGAVGAAAGGDQEAGRGRRRRDRRRRACATARDRGDI